MLDLPVTDRICLAQVIWHEARGESERGQRGVAHVVINRSKKRNKPICAIIREPNQFQINLKKTYKGRDWDKAYRIASYPGRDPTAGALFFRSSKGHFSGKRITTAIGHHSFWK